MIPLNQTILPGSAIASRLVDAACRHRQVDPPSSWTVESLSMDSDVLRSVAAFMDRLSDEDILVLVRLDSEAVSSFLAALYNGMNRGAIIPEHLLNSCVELVDTVFALLYDVYGAAQ